MRKLRLLPTAKVIATCYVRTQVRGVSFAIDPTIYLSIPARLTDDDVIRKFAHVWQAKAFIQSVSKDAHVAVAA